MDQAALAEIKSFEATGDTEHPRYMELLIEQHYVHHVLRMPPDEWPDPVQRGFAHINPAIYVSMQGPSELGISADAGDRRAARHDGPRAHADDGRAAAEGPLPVLPGRQPPGHV